MWTDGNGFFYEGDCRAGDRAATAEEVAAYKASIPPPERRASFGDALERLTNAERDALYAAKAQNLTLALFFDRALSQGTINLDADDTKQALAMVVAAGLFTQARLAELFAPS